ncbi:MAG TPA: hypothetical protein VFZ21_30870 [Gemmatimonadaceae bacterium]|nr:hypothetical protein [Gemmatimonadaceae bacterium]
MNEWALPATLAAGVGLGLVFAVAAVGWALWAWFGRDATMMLAEAWRARLSAALRVAPPPLPPLEAPIRGNAAEPFWTPEQREDRPS